MMIRKAIVFICLCITLSMPMSVYVYALEYISLINLIATPEKYHGKKVSVIGYVKIRFEGQGIYLSKDDANNNITRNALWLLLTEEQLSKYQFMSNRYVIIEGTFDAKMKGHGGMYSGTIKDIERFDEWVK